MDWFSNKHTDKEIFLRNISEKLMKDIDAEYYGYRDEVHGVLVPMVIMLSHYDYSVKFMKAV